MNLKYLYDSLPYRMTAKDLFNWHALDVARLHAVQSFYDRSKFFDVAIHPYLRSEYVYSGGALLASLGPDAPNNGFESGSSGWSMWGTSSVVTDSSKAHSGSNFLQLSASSGSGAAAIMSSYIPVAPGQQVTMGGWAYRETGSGGHVGWVVEISDSTHTAFSWTGTTPSGVDSAAWTYVGGIFTVPSGGAYVRLYCEIYLPSSSTTARCDDGFLSASPHYFHPDHLSARVTTDANGNVIGQQGHYAFGESWYAANTTTKYQFTSYERDSESGNDYAQARYHINRLGRFSSPDQVSGSPANPQSLARVPCITESGRSRWCARHGWPMLRRPTG